MKEIKTNSTSFQEVRNAIPGFMSQIIAGGEEIPLARLIQDKDGHVVVDCSQMTGSDRKATRNRLKSKGLL